jgi:hypothetical protein
MSAADEPAPGAPSDVDLGAPARAFPASPPAPADVSLPAATGDGLPAAPPARGAEDDGDDDGNLFDDPRGWVLIPVTLAAGRLAMAARERLAQRQR